MIIRLEEKDFKNSITRIDPTEDFSIFLEKLDIPFLDKEMALPKNILLKVDGYGLFFPNCASSVYFYIHTKNINSEEDYLFFLEKEKERISKLNTSILTIGKEFFPAPTELIRNGGIKFSRSFEEIETFFMKYIFYIGFSTFNQDMFMSAFSKSYLEEYSIFPLEEKIVTEVMESVAPVLKYSFKILYKNFIISLLMRDYLP